MLAALLAILGSMVAIGAGGGGGSSSRESTADTARQTAGKKEPTDGKGEVEPPVMKPPVVEPSVVEPPVVKPPVVEPPVVEPPVVEPPVVEPPVVKPPVVEPPVVEPPVVEPPVVEPPVVEPPIGTPTPPTQNTDSSNGGDVEDTVISGNTFNVAGGRVTTLNVQNQENVDSIRILNGPDHGNLTVNPDNTMALVMSMENDFSGAINIQYEVSYNDSATQTFSNQINVATSTQQAGWGQGHHYMLETDEDDNVIVEAGDNHREVYVSDSGDALNRADIAAIEGVNPGQITNSWLRDHPEYGGSEDMALDTDTGMGVWNSITGLGSEPSSNWLLFEKGYEYDLGDNFYLRGLEGEDELHPIHITSFGDGDKPVINSAFAAFAESAENVVISSLSLNEGAVILEANNVIFDDLDITNDGFGVHFQSSENMTLRNSSVVDSFQLSPPGGGASWSGAEHSSGLLVGANEGLLVEGTLFDHNGWAEDYREDLSADGGKPPNMFSHNVYINFDNLDVTFRDNITMQAAATGAQVRSGGFIEDNLFLDNNVVANFLGGDEGAGPLGNYTLFTDNVATSAGFRVAPTVGGTSLGIYNSGVDSTLLDNIITHLADPNNPDELADKPYHQPPLEMSSPAFYDDTIIHNWLGASGNGVTGVNTDELNVSTLNATTIQIFAQELLGDPNAGIPELADFLRAQANGQLDDYVDADLIIEFFQTGFGLSIDDRLTPETLRFTPNELGDGIRWDNRLNWDTDDLPGTMAGDSVDLGGNWVNYGGTTTIEDLDFGEGGTLNVSHGSLTINDHTAVAEAGGELNVSNAGQVWMDGYTDLDELEIDVDGGRFANTGLFVGNADIDITDGEVILATDGADMILRDNTELEIIGDDAKVGFDGESNGTGVLMMADGAQLTFTSQNGEGLSTIEEFRSGHFGDDPNIQSGVNLGNASLELNLANLSGAGTHSLINVDQLIGEFGEINVVGLGGRDASVTIDYDTDEVFMTLASGSGNVSFNTIGDQNNAQASDELWAALTNGHGIYPDDPANDIPAEEDDLDEVA